MKGENPENNGEEPILESLTYAGDISEKAINQQLSSVDTMLNRATLFIGLAGILLGIVLGWDINEVPL